MLKRLLNVVRQVSIADSAGAPIEMKTREDILKNIDKYLSKFPDRNGDFAIGCRPGEYSDDTLMTISVIRYLMRLLESKSYVPFDFRTFIKDLLDVYDEDEAEKGVGRGGLGSFKEVAIFKGGDKVEYQMKKNMERVEKSKGCDESDEVYLGTRNGSGMRLNPFIIVDIPDKKMLTEHLIGMTISTHNDVVAVIGNILMVNILRALYDDKIDSRAIVNYSIEWLKGGESEYQYYTMDLDGTKKIFEMMVTKIPCINTFSKVVSFFLGYLTKVDNMPNCNDDLSNVDIDVISIKHSPYCVQKGGTGLHCSAIPTVGWFHYLIKNVSSCKTALDALKRCLLLGGDTDTIAVYVYPMAHVLLNRRPGIGMDGELPDYIMRQMLESNEGLLEKRINKQ